MNKCFDCGADIYEEDPYFHFGYCVPCFDKHISMIEGDHDVKGAAILIALTIMVWATLIIGILVNIWPI